VDGHTILVIVSLICELGAAGIGLWQPENKFNLMALGLFFFILATLVH